MNSKFQARLERHMNHAGGMLGLFTVFDTHTGDDVFMRPCLEREWNDNKSNVSCIPEGEYEVMVYNSPKFSKVFALQGNGVTIDPMSSVRWGILIHPANYPHQLEGCIALGTKAVYDEDSVRVESSRDALKALQDVVGSNPFDLIITREHW